MHAQAHGRTRHTAASIISCHRRRVTGKRERRKGKGGCRTNRHVDAGVAEDVEGRAGDKARSEHENLAARAGQRVRPAPGGCDCAPPLGFSGIGCHGPPASSNPPGRDGDRPGRAWLPRRANNPGRDWPPPAQGGERGGRRDVAGHAPDGTCEAEHVGGETGRQADRQGKQCLLLGSHLVVAGLVRCCSRVVVGGSQAGSVPAKLEQCFRPGSLSGFGFAKERRPTKRVLQVMTVCPILQPNLQPLPSGPITALDCPLPFLSRAELSVAVSKSPAMRGTSHHRGVTR